MVELLEVTNVSLAYLINGGFAVLFTMISLLVKEKLFLGEVVFGTAFGIAIGPYGANAFNPRSWGNFDEVTLEIMRIILAVGLFAVGVELPKAYLAEHARSLITLTVPAMAAGWFICAGLIRALFPQLTYVSALAISACLTPTDPVLASSIVGGKFASTHVPLHVRQLLSAESAANDGLAYPFLSLSVYLTLESSVSTAFEKFFLIGVLYQVVLGTLLGTCMGLTFSYVLRYCQKNSLLGQESFLAQHLALAVLTIGVASTLGMDDLLAAFAAGSAVSWDGNFNAQTEDTAFASVLDLLINCFCFIYIGAWLPFHDFNVPELGIIPWKLVVLFIGILALRRIPCILLLYKFIPDIKSWREALFCGHFGPMGVGAVFISTMTILRLPTPNSPPQNQTELLASVLQPIVAFTVLGSILIHGLSIPVFWWGRIAGTHAGRTLSITASRTLTFASGGPGNNIPDWLLDARRGARNEATDGVVTTSDVNAVERGEQVTTRKAAGVSAQLPQVPGPSNANEASSMKYRISSGVPGSRTDTSIPVLTGESIGGSQGESTRPEAIPGSKQVQFVQ